MKHDYRHELQIRDAERRRDQTPLPTAPSPTDPVPTASNDQIIVMPPPNTRHFGGRADQREAGETPNKHLSHMNARRGPARPPTYVGPIRTPEPGTGVPESERR
jgi:hypothetical protein